MDAKKIDKSNLIRACSYLLVASGGLSVDTGCIDLVIVIGDRHADGFEFFQ